MNFVKQIATFLKGDFAAGELRLKDTHASVIYDIISQSGDFVSKYGSGIEAVEETAGSKTYAVDEEFETFQNRGDFVGQRPEADVENITIGSRVHYWSKVTRLADKKMAAVDANKFASLVSKRLAKAINQDKKIWNRLFFREMFAKVSAFATGQNADATKLRVIAIPSDLTTEDNLRKAWNQLSALRKLISLHKDASQGIDNMDAEAIVGDIDAYLTRQMNGLGFNGGGTDVKKFIKGTNIETIATWNGLQENPYINEVGSEVEGQFFKSDAADTKYNVAACMGTTLTAKFMFRIVAANAGKRDNLSGALGYHYESLMGADLDAATNKIVDNKPTEILRNTMWVVVYKDNFSADDIIKPTSTAFGGAALPAAVVKAHN